MKDTTSCSNSGGLILTVLMAISLLLTGCTNNPTMTEAETYFQVKAEQTKYDLYKERIKDSKARLTEVLPELLTNQQEPPPSRLGALTAFLEHNDCTDAQLSFQAKMNCYRVTRVLLINTTRELDRTDVKLYAGQRTVTQLVDNINMLIDSLDTPK